jgi:hydroxymethylglutaryl-CoA lyase
MLHGAGATLELIVSTAWGCPYEGEIPLDRVAWVVDEGVRVGVDSVTFGDTTGMGTPTRVVALVERMRTDHPNLTLAMHFHNTRGTGLANLLAALQLGITQFDASVGGLGGCPYAPGATGNIATEEVVAMVEDMGVKTGVDLDALLEAAELAQRLVGGPLPSNVLRAGADRLIRPSRIRCMDRCVAADVEDSAHRSREAMRLLICRQPWSPSSQRST